MNVANCLNLIVYHEITKLQSKFINEGVEKSS